MIQDVVAKTKGEARFFREENRMSKGSIGMSGGGCDSDRRESWLQRRGTVIKSQRSYESTTDEEEMSDRKRMSKKILRRDVESDLESKGG